MRRLALLLALLAVPLAACGRGADGSGASGASGASGGAPSAAPTGSTGPVGAARPEVSLRRGGGFAGTQDQILVRPDGRWLRSGDGAGGGARPAGTLSAAQNAALTRMTADPALFRTTGGSTVGCADGYELTLAVGARTISWTDCGDATDRPAAAQGVADFLLSSTK
jgi:hypothetical protein